MDDLPWIIFLDRFAAARKRPVKLAQSREILLFLMPRRDR
jgi:hypothetical protein